MMRMSLSFSWLLAGLFVSCSDPGKIDSTQVEEATGEEAAVTFTPRPFDPAIVRNIEAAKNPPPAREEKPELSSPDKTNPHIVDGRERDLAGQLLEMPEGEAMSLAMTELIRRWAAKDLDAALEFGSQLGKFSEARRAFYRGIGDEMARERPEELLETIEGGLWWQGQWRPERTAVLKVSETDLDRAVSHFSNAMEGKQHGEVAYHFASRIAAEQSVDDALAFAESLENTKGRGYAIRAAVMNWTETDTVAATDYVNSLVDPYLQSNAIQGMIQSIWQTNPSETMEWTMAIKDTEIRESTLTRLAQNWNNDNDRDNLMKLMERNDLTNEDRTALDHATR